MGEEPKYIALTFSKTLERERGGDKKTHVRLAQKLSAGAVQLKTCAAAALCPIFLFIVYK